VSQDRRKRGGESTFQGEELVATDIILDDEGKERITLAAVSLKTTAADLIVDSPLRHTGNPGLRRAMVHSTGDGLTLNFNRDYPDGLTLLDAKLRLRVNTQIAMAPILPKRAEPGDLFAVRLISPLSLVSEGLTIERDTPTGRKPPRRPSPHVEGLEDLGVLVSDDILDDLGRIELSVISNAIEREAGSYTLWFCVRGGARRIAYWREIPLGDLVKGTG
jgi:hypothetical protein